jgi:hypothetical protein
LDWQRRLIIVVLPGLPGGVVDGFARAYRPGGEDLRFPVYVWTETPVMLVGVSVIDFGPDPEARRASAPRRDRSTVSTREEEYDLGITPMIVEPDPCDLDPSLPECNNSDPTYPVSGTGTFCWVSAGSSGDDDGDGFLESCEFAVAAAFAPELLVQTGDYDPSREPYWAAKPIYPPGSSGRVRMFYALSYHNDPDHRGDSEFVVVEGRHVANGNWEFHQMYTAAHEGTGADSGDWTTAPAFSTSRPLAPRVWVADSKHASYNSRNSCNSGGIPGFTDDCSGPYYAEGAQVLSNANLGRQNHPLGCVYSRVGGAIYIAYECFWTASRFHGWWDWNIPGEDYATGYNTHLANYMPM